MNAIDTFAAEASAYVNWLLSESDGRRDAAREALIRLTRLYGAALDLPTTSTNTKEGSAYVEIAARERQCALKAAARLPFDSYGELFDPKVLPPEEPVVASLADDLADIYEEVAAGLASYNAGDSAGAGWHWRFGLYSHWGRHATGAIRALHCWLADGTDEP